MISLYALKMWLKVVAEVCARLMTASRKSTSSGVSVARSAIERGKERGIFEMVESCTRVLGGAKDMTHMRRKTT